MDLILSAHEGVRNALLPYYLWIKATHVIFAIAWMAGLLMAPRLRIYQLSSAVGEPLFETMSDASRRLKKIILNPAMHTVWALALVMLWLNPSLFGAGWFHVKLALVIVLTVIHVWITLIGKRVDAARSGISEKRLRLFNEVPFLLLIGIVLMAIAKPF